MSRRSIGIICSSPAWGGLEINTVRLSDWLQEKDWDIHLMTVEGAATINNAGKKVTSVSVFSKNSGTLNRLRQLGQWVKKNHIRILFVPYNKDLKLAAAYKRYFNRCLPLIYQQHMMVGVPKRDLIHTRRYAMIDKWIAPLEYLKEEALQKTKVAAEKIEVIPFGLETKNFIGDHITRPGARNHLHLPEDAFVIGMLGRLDPKKGHDLVVQAVAKLRAAGENVHALFMGSKTVNEGDAYVATLQQQIKTGKLEAFIHFRPYDPEVMTFFKAIDVFAMPSHGETFGMVTVEAMAARVPVIGTNNFGTAEILGYGKFGWLFAPKDLNSFCDALDSIRAGSGVAEKLAAAFVEAEISYSRERMVQQISVLLEELL